MRIADIEDAIVTALEPLVTQGVDVSSYSVAFPAADVRGIAPRLPAVFVVWNECSYEIINQVDHIVVQFNIIVCAESLRDEADARRGAYDIIDSVRSLLHRKHVAPKFSIARCRRESIASSDDGIVMCRAEYEVKARI